MKKFLAILCTISWAVFWVFGYLALAASMGSDAQLTHLVLAGLGFLLGTFSYLRLMWLQGPQKWRHVRQE